MSSKKKSTKKVEVQTAVPAGKNSMRIGRVTVEDGETPIDLQATDFIRGFANCLDLCKWKGRTFRIFRRSEHIATLTPAARHSETQGT